jgi:hypothetical protein
MTKKEHNYPGNGEKTIAIRNATMNIATFYSVSNFDHRQLFGFMSNKHQLPISPENPICHCHVAIMMRG